MSKPTFVFVPGAWHTPAVYGGVIASLKTYGYPSVKVDLPSVGGAPPTYDFTEDVAAIKDAVTKLVEDGKHVVLVAHSYSGLPVGELPKELGSIERESKQLPGGVIRLVFIMAAIVPEGFQVAPRNDVSTLYPFMKVDLEKGIATVAADEAKRLFYHDLSEEEASRWASQLQPQSIGVFWSTTTTAAWRYVPSTYVLCENDRPFPKASAEILLAAAKKTDDHRIDAIEQCDSGHSPMLSRVEWTVEVLRRAAGEKSE